MFEKARALVLSDKAKARKALAEAIRQKEKDEIDAALAAAGDAFEQLELLSADAARLEGEVGVGDGRRPVIAGHARSAALVAAVWNAARPLAKRLGLRAVPGSNANIRPLTAVYPEPKETE